MKIKHLGQKAREFFKEQKFNINNDIKTAFNNLGETPLNCAIRMNQMEIIEILMEAGVDLHAKDKNGRTPLIAAVHMGNLPLVKILIQDIADLNQIHLNGFHLLDAAVAKPVTNENKKSTLAMVKFLVEKGVKLESSNSEDGYTPLLQAAQNGYRTVVKYLLSKKANINHQAKGGLTALHTALGKETDVDHHPRVVHQLLNDPGVNIHLADCHGNTPLMKAAGDGHLELVERMIAMEADIHAADKFGQTAMHLAAYSGHDKVMRSLVEQKANIHTAARGGATPISIAAMGSHQKAVKFLLKQKASLEVACEGNEFPAGKLKEILSQLASTSSSREEFLERWLKIVEASKEKINVTTLQMASRSNLLNFNKQEKDAKESTKALVLRQLTFRLCEAAAANELEKIRELIKAGAEVNALHCNSIKTLGASPLHYACQYGQFEAAELLVTLGADPSIKTLGGKTPYEKLPAELDPEIRGKFAGLLGELLQASAATSDPNLDPRQETKSKQSSP